MIVREEGESVDKHLFDFQEQTVRTLLNEPGKHIVIANCGSGKGPTSIVWSSRLCDKTGKKKVLVITTSSKTKVKDKYKRNDFEQDADNFCGLGFRKTHTLETVSWDLLYKWVAAHSSELGRWVYIADEVAKARAGVSSRRGRAFLKIASATKDWSGYTATPGDSWKDYYAYFQACGKVRNKTEFMRRFCNVQTFKGFPEIVGYYEERTMKQWWADISYAPDTSKMLSELPKATYSIVRLGKPKGYSKVLKMRQKLCSDGDGELSEEYDDIISNPSALAHYLRQICFTKDKEQWLSDFIEGLGDKCLIFYNYIETGDAIESLAYKVLPKGAKVWRIDGKNHIIPTEDMMGDRDIVLAQWQSGSEGLNLQFVNVLVIAEMTYSYSTHYQAKGRIARIGQTRPMFYYLLLSSGTIEENILGCIQTKKDFSEETWMLSQKLLKEGEHLD